MEYIKFNPNGSVGTIRGNYNLAKIDSRFINYIAVEMIAELEIESKKGNRHAVLEITNELTDKEKDILMDYFIDRLGYNKVSFHTEDLKTVITVSFSYKNTFG